ncbi:MAG: hypothetical protein QM652_02030 [Legionella sp.]|uniref:hypothetical protein n=1 Tax=Legionella sp. TaxID=459 RepID=UPI0039E4A671
MTINPQQLSQILNYITQFANANQEIRITLENVHFNIRTTGGTLDDYNYKEPTLTDLQKLQINSSTGLPFKIINFRPGDDGPDLASIMFQEEKFIIRFFEKSDPQIIDFCAQLNQIIGKPQNYEIMQQEENKYQEELIRAKEAVSKIPSENFKKSLNQVEKLKKEKNTPVTDLIEALQDIYADARIQARTRQGIKFFSIQENTAAEPVTAGSYCILS